MVGAARNPQGNPPLDPKWSSDFVNVNCDGVPDPMTQVVLGNFEDPMGGRETIRFHLGPNRLLL
jgi:hypothetical protein